MRGKFGVGVVYCLLVVLFPNVLRAQLTTTTIYGRVTDANGGTIAGAQVAVTNTDTNLSRTAQTSAEGEYRIEFLPVGNYRVEIAAQAFKRFVRAGVVLEVNVPARVDSVMQLGDFNQIVTVAESVPLVDTTSPEIGRTIENQEVVNLPLVNRNVYQLLQLTPGVQNSSFNPGQPNPVITLGYPEQRTFINGGVDGGAGSVSYYLDGGINMTGLRNTGNILPNPDAIQEYRVETNNYNAEYGKMSSGVITVITKTGTAAAAIRGDFRWPDQKGQDFRLRLLPGFAPAQQLPVHRRDVANCSGGGGKYGCPSEWRFLAEPVHLRFADCDLPFVAGSHCPEAAHFKRVSQYPHGGRWRLPSGRPKPVQHG